MKKLLSLLVVVAAASVLNVFAGELDYYYADTRGIDRETVLAAKAAMKRDGQFEGLYALHEGLKKPSQPVFPAGRGILASYGLLTQAGTLRADVVAAMQN